MLLADPYTFYAEDEETGKTFPVKGVRLRVGFRLPRGGELWFKVSVKRGGEVEWVDPRDKRVLCDRAAAREWARLLGVGVGTGAGLVAAVRVWAGAW